MTSAAQWRKQTVKTRELYKNITEVEFDETCAFDGFKFKRVYTMATFDVPDIKWVERFIVGISHPDKYLTQDEINSQMQAVNSAIRYGKIISVEQNFTILSHGEKDIISQYTVYHVGFKRRPPGK